MGLVRRVSSGLGVAILLTALVVVWVGIGRFIVTGQREDLDLAVGVLVFLVLVVAIVALVLRRSGELREAAVVPLLPAAFLGVDLGSFEGAVCGVLVFLLLLFLAAWALGRGWRAGRGR